MFLSFALRVQISLATAVSFQNQIVTKSTHDQEGQMSPPTDNEAPKAQPQIKSKNGKPNNQKQKKKKKKQNNSPKNQGYYFTQGAQTHQKPTIILPHLHKEILSSLNGAISPEPVYVYPGSPEHKVADTRSTNIVGFFTCPNASCDKDAWSSGRVAIVIRRFDLPTGIGYNATIYNQRCKACNELGALNIDKEIYVERLVYRLKVWAGVPVVRPPFNGNKGTPPHRTDLCEGGKRGVCVACGLSGDVRPSGSRRGNPLYWDV